MDDFPGILARDFGFKPQGKAAPMAPPRSSPTTASYGIGPSSRSSPSAPIFDDQHDSPDGLLFNEVFGGPPKYTEARSSSSVASVPPSSSFDYDSFFNDQNSKFSSSSAPVFDKPVYDDDISYGLPGLKSASTGPFASVKFDNVFSSIGATNSSSPPKYKQQYSSASAFDDLLGNLGRKETESKRESANEVKNSSADFDDLLPGFGPSISRSVSDSNRTQKPSANSDKAASSVMEDPFVVLESIPTPAASSSELFTDPLEEISNSRISGNARVDNSSVNKAEIDDVDPFDNLGRSVPAVSPEINHGGKDMSPSKTRPRMSGTFSSYNNEPIDKYPVDNADGYSRKKIPNDDFQDSHERLFDMPNASTDFRRPVGQSASSLSYANSNANETDSSPGSEEIPESSDDVWLMVSEIPLFTEPTCAPPPSRPPPPRPPRIHGRKKVNGHSSFPNYTRHSQSPISSHVAKNSPTSQIDELEEFGMGRPWNNINEHSESLHGEEVGTNSSAAESAAVMEEAMAKAEAKFKQMREREHLKAARSKDAGQPDKDFQQGQQSELRERQERLDRERQQREGEEEEREQRRLQKERERAHEIEREREEKESEQRRLERERERAREIEREKARQAVERATREARERAATEARLKAERAAVEKAAAGARERAERAAVQRAQAEARERAAAGAKERAERAAGEAKERANAEARERAERAAVGKAAADARARAERAAVERAAMEARERAAATARANQQKNENQPKDDYDFESFFSNRASSAPRPRASDSDPMSDTHNKGGPEMARRTPVGVSSNMRKASSTTNIFDDLSSIMGGAPSGGFKEVEGETEERRRARLERHQRTQERAAKALDEKNQRDLQAQREQAERHRIAETLDVEIKRWAAGKEGNLRALLSTLQYVLWPECGWQPVSLTDLITGAAVKKVYRKATLCIHPDKVQQKGANLQQKYVAEKVFDLLKEAWNKFNSEELF